MAPTLGAIHYWSDIRRDNPIILAALPNGVLSADARTNLPNVVGSVLMKFSRHQNIGRLLELSAEKLVQHTVDQQQSVLQGPLLPITNAFQRNRILMNLWCKAVIPFSKIENIKYKNLVSNFENKHSEMRRGGRKRQEFDSKPCGGG